ncbi:MAG TPA: hypothetical protein PKN86_13730, partial [Candidatus Obscuribacter sp.]|nr:hypothetical protein [Candidatus Obscuribacter sp.]
RAALEEGVHVLDEDHGAARDARQQVADLLVGHVGRGEREHADVEGELGGQRRHERGLARAGRAVEEVAAAPRDAERLIARAAGEEALQDINSAIDLSESNDLKIVRALIFKALSRNQEALSDLSEFIANRTMAVKVWACMLLPIAREISHQLNMTLPEAYRMRSELYEEMGQRQLAENDLAQAQKLEQKLSKKQPRLKL